MTRKYNIKEIDALRQCEGMKYLYGNYCAVAGSYGSSRQFNELEMIKIVEERVRTNMIAGLTAEDLIKNG